MNRIPAHRISSAYADFTIHADEVPIGIASASGFPWFDVRGEIDVRASYEDGAAVGEPIAIRLKPVSVRGPFAPWAPVLVLNEDSIGDAQTLFKLIRNGLLGSNWFHEKVVEYMEEME